MSAKSTAVFFCAGLYLSTKLKQKQKSIVVPSVASFCMLYSGSYYEFDNLVAEQNIRSSSPGFWIIGGGIMSAGVAAGNM